MIGAAFELALRAHEGQVDQGGAAYIGHVVRVCAGVEGHAERVVALLHDVVEDAGVGLTAIETQFGPEVAAAVEAISRRPGERPEPYYARVAANPLARKVKLADIADNADPARLSLLDEETRSRLTRKYAKAREALA
ncbi:MAG: HD domain-containing protein [Pseudomonadota bacterium]